MIDHDQVLSLSLLFVLLLIHFSAFSVKYAKWRRTGHQRKTENSRWTKGPTEWQLRIGKRNRGGQKTLERWYHLLHEDNGLGRSGKEQEPMDNVRGALHTAIAMVDTSG